VAFSKVGTIAPLTLSLMVIDCQQNNLFEDSTWFKVCNFSGWLVCTEYSLHW